MYQLWYQSMSGIWSLEGFFDEEWEMSNIIESESRSRASMSYPFEMKVVHVGKTSQGTWEPNVINGNHIFHYSNSRPRPTTFTIVL